MSNTGNPNTTSSYLIDLSKKIYISGLGTTKGGIPWIYYGDLNTQSLSDVGFSFTENFKEVKEEAEKSMEKITKVLTTTMYSVIKKIPLFKNTSFELPKSESIKDVAIFFKAVLSQIGTGSLYAKGEIDDFINSLNKEYAYIVPMRMSSPSIDMSASKSIVVEFAYGKCNMFSAREEVWEPLMHIQAALFPKAEDSEDGLITIKGIPAPAPQIVSVLALESLFQKDKEDKDKAIPEITDYAKTLMKQVERVEGIDESSVKISGPIFEGRDRIKDAKAYKNFGESMKNVFDEKGLSVGDKTLDLKSARDAIENYITPKEGREEGTEDDFPKSSIDEGEILFNLGMAEAKRVAIGEEKVTLQLPSPKKIKVTPKGVTGNPKVSLKLSEDKKSGFDLNTVLHDLILFNKKKSAKIIQGLYKERFENNKGGAHTINFAYPNIYKTNIEDVRDMLGVNGKGMLPRISLNDMLITKAEVTFDFNNTDEYGYPMSGKLKISGIWNLRYPGNTLTLNDKGRDENIVENTIPYNP